MAKPKRMSDMFASSSTRDADTTMATATPPYSSEGPTLPVIGPTTEPSGKAKESKAGTKRIAQSHTSNTDTKKQPQPQPTINPALYKPWSLLPPSLLKLVESQAHLRSTQNVIPVVFTRNQNVKSGINRLKTYLGAYRDPASIIEMPDSLKQEDLVIAVSAQGQGTTKLVSIVDMVRRIVAPSGKEDINTGGKVETWWMYTALASVETERRTNTGDKEVQEIAREAGETQESLEEEEAFEPMVIDGQEREKGVETVHKRKEPVLTVWLTRKKIAAFKQAFGEQSFTVKILQQEED
ncbi:uncharacterized protein K460DRAFT_372207 [Cucurbitaria berberidis CBS 394.84]|uniref:DNA/RNA-binding protein Alba-like domain-containing protein n=1 Tax=Cucurbitaria berberidis CBS 394.84 TaxID=1168544 RepID=A0A9P4GNL3_9PLEO|nr:uncharacterized protein K460DRAFT_372207 [Cucurbitaria berberidis CBS 394.84]KAF1849783.1 hypothetical protein K460DRAFT_372207 [Cucurbitaria berberidis CBS 394.84]